MDTDTSIPEGRIEAAKQRSMFYRAPPCPQGHPGLRYTSNGACVECAKGAAASLHERVKKLLNGEAE